jgi:signal transduction histidine kinase
MKYKPFYQISSVAVFTALIVLAFLQYRWADSSAEKSIMEIQRSFNISIYSTIAREFNNFDFLQRDPMEWKDERSNFRLQEDLELIYSGIITNFGSKYINSFSYIDLNRPEESFMLIDGLWQKRTSPVELLDEMNNKLQHPDFREMSIIPDKNDPKYLWILNPLMGKENVLIFTHFEMMTFFYDIIIPQLQIIWGEYDLHYSFTPPAKTNIFNEKNYKYSIMKTITNNLFFRKSATFFYMPYYISPYSRSNRDENEMNHFKPYIYFDILTEGKSHFREKENEMAVQWLLSLLLLLGLAGAYGLIIYQISHLKQLRIREKEFVATVTHELRTPLTVIQAAADNIKSGIVSPDRVGKYGHLIIDQSTRLATMIEGILLFSRLEGKAEQAPPLKTVNFQEIKNNIEIVIKTLSSEYNKNIKMDFGSLPAFALTDGETIELILTNLITNSCKHAYTKEEPGEIRIRGHVQMPDALIFTVDDDGFGIEKSERKHIFEPFFRGNKSFHNQVKGSGLGLFLSFK